MKNFKEKSFKKKHHSASVYSKKTLLIYDFLVLGISNEYIWKCPTRSLLKFYNEHVSSHHLDVGVGTGYYLNKCKYPVSNPTVHLLDLNSNSLTNTAKRIKRYNPIKHEANVLSPLQIELPKFHSIAINYLLHCLPGDIQFKEKVFHNLTPFLNKNGVIFGSTILGTEFKANPLAKKLMKFYNSKGIFCNKDDSLNCLEKVMQRNFSKYFIKQIGCVALFSGVI